MVHKHRASHAHTLPRRKPDLSIDLHMVALRLLHALGELLPDHAVLLGERTEALLHAAFHALQPAHVDVSLRALHQLPEVLCELGHLGLDVHLLPRCVLLLTRHRVVVAELVGVALRVLLVLVIVEQGLGVWHSHEEPRQALELAAAVRVRARLVVEEQPEVGPHGGDASACGKHDDVRVVLLREQHLRTGGAGDQDVIARGHVADVVRAHAPVHLFVREPRASLVRLVLADLAVGILAIHLHDALHAEGDRLGALVVPHGGGGDGVEPDLRRGLTLLVGARSDDADGLALDVWHIAAMLESYVSGLPIRIARVLGQGVRVDVVRNHLALVRRLRHEDVPRDLLALHHTDALLLHCRGATGHTCCAHCGGAHGRRGHRGRHTTEAREATGIRCCRRSAAKTRCLRRRRCRGSR
mmetsp:Transcript_109548/g.283193  ORF Transcript_109548/g.283193 Transcript_109548/m.283193 type:complete len:413 (+) Transcript_109548:31-1269(+)